MAININRNVEDTFYRYKMPRLLAKVEGKGNGIKTVVANMVDIAKALNRPPTYPTKYFGCELGAQTQFDFKNERYIVNGDHDAVKLQDLLDGFIRKFVLCHECDNPETTMTIKGTKISLSCKACGHVTGVDPRHRLTTFVVKNPPTVENGASASDANGAAPVETAVIGGGGNNSSSKKGKVVKQRCSVNKEHNVSGGGQPASVENGHNSGGSADGTIDQDGDDVAGDDDWAVDPDDAEQRQRELVGNMANITMNDDLEKSVDERLKIFMDYLKEKPAGDLDPKLVQIEAERLDVKEEALLVICRVLFDHNPDLLADESTINRHRALFLRFSTGNDRAQRHLLGAIEQIVTSSDGKSALLKMPRILELFYDADVLEEKQILKWGDKASSKYVTKEANKEVRAKATTFLKWLKEAEEESGGDDEDDDDGLEIVYDSKPQPRAQNGATAVISAAATKDDDFDIDNI